MITLGITGRSGCGKSTVTAVFAGHGVPLADADQISREMPAARLAAAARAGRAVRGRHLKSRRHTGSPPAGRPRLCHAGRQGRAGRSDPPGDRAPHPGGKAGAHSEAGAPLFVLDGAVIVGTAAQAECDRLCVVTAPFETRCGPHRSSGTASRLKWPAAVSTPRRRKQS